jgi:hypothetical protein
MIAESINEERCSMHTIKVVSGGFLLLTIFLFVARYLEGAHAGAIRNAAKYFLPSWLVLAGVNMWFGVSRANYSVREETPMFVLVFAVPAIAVLLVLWRS